MRQCRSLLAGGKRYHHRRRASHTPPQAAHDELQFVLAQGGRPHPNVGDVPTQAVRAIRVLSDAHGTTEDSVDTTASRHNFARSLPLARVRHHLGIHSQESVAAVGDRRALPRTGFRTRLSRATGRNECFPVQTQLGSN